MISIIIVSCSGGKHISKKLSRKLKAEYCELELKKFPDNEINIKFTKNISNKRVVLVQSFYDDINDKIVETLFAAHTAKELGAKKVELVSPYFPYWRKDKRFKPGECVSIQVMKKLFSVFDKIYIVEPHLHRIKNIKTIFPQGVKISVGKYLVNYIHKLKIHDILFMGPDMESSQWVKELTHGLGKNTIILSKERFSSKKVKVTLPKNVKIKKETVIIVDDIISTGHTMLETIKLLRKMKLKRIYCIAIHGVFAEDALKRLRKYSKVVATNTIPNRVAKIDITEEIVKAIK